MDYKIENDCFGEVCIPQDVYWGKSTQRSINNFNIGIEKMPFEIIKAYCYIKKAAAIENKGSKLLSKKKANAIVEACNEILDGKLNENFPLSVWQTGSGTQTHMNVNEVIANRATELLNSEEIINAHDDVNISQSSNDTFPTAVHIAVVLEIQNKLLPAIKALEATLKEKSIEFNTIIKIGRTHLQDAVPLTLGQEFSGWVEMLHKSHCMIESALEPVRELAIGGTAVGTGLNSLENFGENVTTIISDLTNTRFISAPNKFHALTSHDTLVTTHGALKALSCDMMKIANDIRWLASGPRCGLGEITIPSNEAGSSIMPGKVNPTQSEAVTMVAVQVMGNDTTIGFAASQGNFELNVFQPVIAYNFLQSIRLLTDSLHSFNNNCAKGIVPNVTTLDKNLENSLMIATALNPHIGYANVAKLVQEAFKNNTSLKKEAIKLNMLSAKEFDKYVDVKKMLHPKEV